MICRKCKKDVPDAPYCCQCGAKQDVTLRGRRGNGLGSVFRHGKGWRAQITAYTTTVDVDGKKRYRQHRRTKDGFVTKKDAIEYLETLRNTPSRTVPRLIDLYIDFEAHDLPKLSKDKQCAYKKARERCESIIGISISDLTVAQMQSVIDAHGNTYYKAKDIKNLLSKLFQKAMPDQFVSQNLALFLSLPELIEEEPIPFNKDEIETMWKAFADGDMFVGYPLLMIYSGMMPGELLSCRKDMVDLEKCEIYGCGKKTKTRKKNSIVFADCVRPVLEELIAWQEGDMLVNVGHNQFYDAYHATLKRIGVRDLPPYSCRHTTGTEAARQNLNAAIVQKIMRHAKISTSQKYIHLGADDAHRGVNAIAHNDKLA